jgi:integrase
MVTTRRGRGEGSIYQRADGYWVATTSARAADGRRVRKVAYGKTKDEARAALRGLQDAPAEGTAPAAESTAAYLTRWLEIGARPTVREATYESYEAVVRLHVIPHIGAVPLAKLTPMTIQGLLTTLEGAGVGVRVRQLTHAVLRRAFNQAVEWRVMGISPVAGVKAPRPPEVERVVWTAEQARVFLTATENDRRGAFYRLALSTSCRLSELLGLKWEDVDLVNGTVSITKQLARRKAPDGTPATSALKTKRAKRVITLPPAAVAALKKHRARLLMEGLSGKPWVFVDEDGDAPYSRTNVSKGFRRLVAKVPNVPSMRFHDLRHTAITLLLAAGEPVKAVSARAGHHKASMTLDVYGHVTPSADAEAAAKVQEVLQ